MGARVPLLEPGIAKMAAFFGPIMAVWFIVLAVGSLPYIGKRPDILLVLNPVYAISFIAHHGTIGFVTLGAVFLAVTEAEAL